MSHRSLTNFQYSVRNATSDALDIYIDGYIVDAPTQEMLRSWYGDETSVSYKSLRDQITATQPKTVNVYINSGGGQVADALAIHDMIVELQARGAAVNTYGRGIIASAATYILMASNNSSISENSWFMIHNVQGGAYGDVNDVENAAKMMRRFNDQIRDLYVNYTGIDAATIASWMNKETWFSGAQAKEKGFVKNVTGQAVFTNAIDETKWPFHNSAVLNAYNAFAPGALRNLSDADKKFLEEMVTHHQMAIEMAKDVLNQTEDPFVQALAGGIIAAQTNEIADMEEVLGDGGDAENKKKKTKPMKMQNSFTHPKNTDRMKVENIQQAIENGFSALMEKLGLKDKAGNEATTNALKAFSDGIVNALKTEVPSEEAVNQMVSNAVAESLKNLGQSEAFVNAVAASTKDCVTKTDLTAALKNSQDEIIAAVAGKTGGKQTENSGKPERRTTPRNRFSGAYQDFS